MITEMFLSGLLTGILLLVFFLVSLIFKPELESFEKSAPIESGFLSFNMEKTKFSMQFFMILLLFIIFDAEFIFIFFSPFLFYWGVFSVIMWFILLTLFLEWKMSKIVWF